MLLLAKLLAFRKHLYCIVQSYFSFTKWLTRSYILPNSVGIIPLPTNYHFLDGRCPYLHRTAGDTERRYHLRYYKTGMCVHDTDSRGMCVKNGPHCAFAHGVEDVRWVSSAGHVGGAAATSFTILPRSPVPVLCASNKTSFPGSVYRRVPDQCVMDVAVKYDDATTASFKAEAIVRVIPYPSFY